MPPKVPALPREFIEPGLHTIGLSAQDIRALLRCNNWCASESRNQQVVVICDFVKRECNRKLSVDVLGHVFGMSPSHIRKIRSKAQNKPKSPYRPGALDEDQSTAVVAFIRNGSYTYSYVIQRDILSFIETNYRERSNLLVAQLLFENA
jgi:hypothetical protein